MSYLLSFPRPHSRRLAAPALFLLVCLASRPAPLLAESRPAGVPEGAVFVAQGKVWVLDLGGKRTVYFAGGGRLAEGPYSGKREGDWTFYHPNGNVRGRGAFRAGRLQGTWKLYHANGKPESEGKYENNYRVGLWTFYTTNGNRRAEGNFSDGYRTGAWTEYYDSGKIFYTGSYSKNREHGDFKYFTEAGTVVQAGRFEHGVRVGEWYICAGGACGKQTFKTSDVPRFSGGVGGVREGKSSAPSDLLDVLDGKKSKRAEWR